MQQKAMFLLLFATIGYPVYAVEDLALTDDLRWLQAEGMVEVVSKQKEEIKTTRQVLSVW